MRLFVVVVVGGLLLKRLLRFKSLSTYFYTSSSPLRAAVLSLWYPSLPCPVSTCQTPLSQIVPCDVHSILNPSVKETLNSSLNLNLDGQSNKVEVAAEMESHEFDNIPGLRLFNNVITAEIQTSLISFVDKLLEDGRNGVLPNKAYLPVSKPHAAVGKSREMVQYGAYTHANRVEEKAQVPPLPPELLAIIDLLEV